MTDFVAINGQIIPYENARIAPFDAGVLHGAGLFETMRVIGGRIIAFDDHLARLTASATALAMPVHLEQSVLAELISEVLQANDLSDARLRLTVTRGDLSNIDAATPDLPTTTLVSASEFKPYPEVLYEKGMTAIVSRYQQNPFSPLCGHKSTSYLDRLLALREAQQSGAGEAFWFTVGEKYLAEGCISNVFIVTAAEEIATCPIEHPEQTGHRMVLPGITRSLVCQLAVESALIVHEKLLTINDLLAAKEVFVTNAIMGIMPVVRIERHGVGDEKPGAVTQQLRQAYLAHLDKLSVAP
ncbi:MAG: hypothetical protein HKL96_06900 [Phycisphaerales bacterium]|nr:hypothetical protein [Phycisphaerales bacterium]